MSFFYTASYLNDVMLKKKLFFLVKTEFFNNYGNVDPRSRPPHTNLDHPSPTVPALSIRTGARRYFPP